MMPGGPLSNKQLKNLKVYAGPKHPHEAQSPELVDVKGLNAKNDGKRA
jgi:large subunit ribosomal protein L13